MRAGLKEGNLLAVPLGAGPWTVTDGNFEDLRIAVDWAKQVIKLDDDSRTSPLVPAHLRYAEHIVQSQGDRVSVYAQMKTNFEAALRTLPAQRRDDLRDTLEALRFIDNRDVLVSAFLHTLSKGKNVEALGIQYLYNEMRDPGDPTFDNIKRVARFLKETKLPLGLKRLKEVNRIAMDGGVEGVDRHEQGAIRSTAVFGDERTSGITHSQLLTIQRNPYLSFTTVSHSGDRYFGTIVYPDPETVPLPALERIRLTSPTVYSRVKKVRENGWSREDPEKLTRDLIEALVDERFKSFNKEIKALGALDTRDKVVAYIKDVALLYRDLVSIHPFVNGNGRSLRLDIFSTLDKVGISRPRLNNPDEDLLSSPTKWVWQVQKGILNTDQMYRDIEKRIAFGLPIENSGAVFFPDRPPDVRLHLKNYQKRTIKEDVCLFPVNDGQFMAYVANRFDVEPELRRAFRSDPLGTFNIIREDYKAFAKTTQFFYLDRAGEPKLVRVELADRDFIDSFGQTAAQQTERWAHKVERWYRPEFIWRGLPNLTSVPTERELLRVFSEFSEYTAPQRILECWQPGRPNRQVVAECRRELARFNHDLVEGNLWRMLSDHINAVGLYHQSYAASTSLQWTIARSFGMGALVIDEDMSDYRKNQEKIASRIVIGAYRAYKDVDTNTFKGVDRRFSARSGRQHEIAAMGGVDPDIVMVVQDIDAKGRIKQSWIRNPELPSQIWVIDGGYHPDDGPLAKLPGKYVTNKVRLKF